MSTIDRYYDHYETGPDMSFNFDPLSFDERQIIADELSKSYLYHGKEREDENYDDLYEDLERLSFEYGIVPDHRKFLESVDLETFPRLLDFAFRQNGSRDYHLNIITMVLFEKVLGHKDSSKDLDDFIVILESEYPYDTDVDLNDLICKEIAADYSDYERIDTEDFYNLSKYFDLSSTLKKYVRVECEGAADSADRSERKFVDYLLSIAKGIRRYYSKECDKLIKFAEHFYPICDKFPCEDPYFGDEISYALERIVKSERFRVDGISSFMWRLKRVDVEA